MSVQAMAWAFDMQMESPSAKLVLLALANFADEEGKCWPSQERLAAMSSQSVDSVQRRLKELVELGFITTIRRARKSSVYCVAWSPSMKPQSAASSPSMKPQTPTMKPQNDPMMPHLCGIEPSIRTTNIEPSVDIEVAPRASLISKTKAARILQEFWDAYPPGRKTGKAAVGRKLESLLRAGIAEETIMAGVRRYAATKPDPQFTKGPLVWLNQGCWDDEITITERTQNGFGGPRPLQDDSRSAGRAAARLGEAARNGQFSFAPLPSLLPEPSGDDVRLLPKR